MKKFQKIIEFASEIHKNEKRKNTGEAFISHPLAVAEKAYLVSEQAGFSLIEREMIYLIGVLHDTIESGANQFQVTEILIDLAYFTDSEIDKIVLAVIRLSRMSKEENVISYLAGIKADKYARIVKLADLEHNLSDLGPGNLRDKYHLCKYFLTN